MLSMLVAEKDKNDYDEAFDGGYEPNGAYKRRKYAGYKEKTAHTHRPAIFIHGQTSVNTLYADGKILLPKIKYYSVRFLVHHMSYHYLRNRKNKNFTEVMDMKKIFGLMILTGMIIAYATAGGLDAGVVEGGKAFVQLMMSAVLVFAGSVFMSGDAEA